MARVHVYVHGRGRGHATRSAAVVTGLRADGHDVRIFAGDDAAEFFAEEPDVDRVDSVRPGQAFAGIPTALARVARGLRDGARDPPDVVVSDGDLPGTLTARLSGIPAVAIGHGLVFCTCERPTATSPSNRAAWRREAAKARLAAMGSARQVPVNFAPLRVTSATATLARPHIALTRPGGTAAPTDGPLLCYFRDPAPARPILRALVDAGHAPLLFAQEDPDIPGVESRPLNRDGFARELLLASHVVSSAGSQLMSECLALGIPQFALHSEGDDEQSLNVAMLRDCQGPQGSRGASFSRALEDGALLDHLAEHRRVDPPWGRDGATAPDVVDATRAAVQALVEPGSP